MDTSKCGKCQEYPAEPEHTCPYQAEINEDKEYLCNCCDGCYQQCAWDI